MNDNYITLTIGKKKNIALIAHDNKKADLIEWCEQNKDILTQHFLCGTGTTARMITDKTGLPVKGIQQWSSWRRPADRCKDRGRKNRFCGILLGSIDSTAT